MLHRRPLSRAAGLCLTWLSLGCSDSQPASAPAPTHAHSGADAAAEPSPSEAHAEPTAAPPVDAGAPRVSTDATAASAPDDADAGEAPSDCDVAGKLKLSAADCSRVKALLLPDTLPASAGNRYADDADAARLGYLVFFDARFSTLSDVRCASCHLPERAFADGKATPELVTGQPVGRNSPTLLNAAWAGPWYFWDGRADSLWSQPLFAFENDREMANSRLALAHALYDTSAFRSRYETVFGPMPALSDAQRFPARGKPGDAAFDGMAADDRDQINRVAANLGKALEAYIRKIAAGRSALDRFLLGDAQALEPNAVEGLRQFAAVGCIQCHSGPALSDGAFHALGIGSKTDRGRATGIAVLQANPFNAAGPYYDQGVGGAPHDPDHAGPGDENAFRTPSLRNLAGSAPYGHDGSFATLMDFLASGHGAHLTAAQMDALNVFLLSLQGNYPARPWGDWPAR